MESESAPYGRQVFQAGGWDHYKYIVDKDRPLHDDGKAHGRHPDESSQMVPNHTHAASTGQVVVNGQTLNIWTYSQLETLSQRVLKERAMAIRGAVGEAKCPAMPSVQKEDLVRWILHVQSQIVHDAPEGDRAGGTEAGEVPSFIAKELKERGAALPEQQRQRLPFGPRKDQVHGATRDNLADLLAEGEAPGDAALEQASKLGIVSQRKNGEGKRHIFPEGNMVASGVSSAGAGHGGRRYMACDDHLMAQKKELEVLERDPRAAALASALQAKGGARVSGAPVSHVSESHLTQNGLVGQYEPAPIGGERRRHSTVQDRMVNVGVADPGDAESRVGGRKHLDGFAGQRFSQGDQHGGHQSTWRRDPSGLRGSSMLC